jgi:hypothetical protein
MIEGRDFETVTEVNIGGVPAASFTVVSPFVIVAVAGTGATGEISITTTGGTGAKSTFTFIGSPTITSFSPAIAKHGDYVEIIGTNLTGVISVSFGGSPASSFIINSPNKITAVVSSGASGDVQISKPEGPVIRKSGFIYNPPTLSPTITSFNPLTAGTGILVNITGVNLDRTTVVSFGGTLASSFVINSSTSVTAIVGSGSSGNIDITTASGTTSLSGFTFSSAPLITSFSPSAARAGASVVITGLNFNGATTVSFGGNPATSFAVVSPTSITAVVGKGASGIISVTSLWGTGSLKGFDFVPVPTIKVDGPTNFTVGGSVVLTAEVDTVYAYQWKKDGIDISGATGKSYTATESGGYSVSITLNSTSQVSASTPIVVSGLAMPVITSADQLTARTGTSVTITGANFSNASAVSFGGNEATSFRVLSPTNIYAIVGAGASGNISVTTPSGTGILEGFQYVPVPIISANGPTSIDSGGSVVLTCNAGEKFKYQWFKDGVPINAAIDSSYRVTQQGAYSVVITLNNVDEKSDITFVKVTSSLIPIITVIKPSTATTGTSINITGANFSGTTAVSFGGTPATSFSVVSATNITAVVGIGTSGSISVTTPSGIATLAGFNYVPVPTITANGPTSFLTGGNVVLTANPGTGYTYQWKKDGADIMGETGRSYTATLSGGYSVSIMLNELRQVSEVTMVKVIFNLPVTNFTIIATSSTCKNSDNGTIKISANKNLNYTAIVTGNGLNDTFTFSNTQIINNLKSGTYKVCISVASEPGFQQCYQTTVSEPEDLSVYSSIVNENELVLNLNGANSYKISLNGTDYTTTKNQITLPLVTGSNKLMITTEKTCQGIIEKNINIFEKPIAYPNPFENNLSLNMGGQVTGSTEISVIDLKGKTVFRKKYPIISDEIQIDLSSLESGLYMLKVSSYQSDTIIKIIKK